jgi:hypothetical protein
MYAVQEPAMGILAGIFSGWCTVRRDKNSNILVDLIIQQFVCISFGVVAYTILIM